MNLSNLTSAIFLLSIALCISGCAIIETLGLMPQTSEQVSVKAGTPTSVVFLCIEKSIQALHKKQSTWCTMVTLRDEVSGVMETGYFSKPNITGFRVKVIHMFRENTVKLKLKGAGPYYADIGVSNGLANLMEEFKLCIKQNN